jgi:dienelactone hydrolase
MAITEGAVCPGCVTGFIHDGAPKGTVGTIANLPTYIAKPPTSEDKTAVIVVIPDLFGWDFINNRLLADEYAEKLGKTVYLPDFMNGTFPFRLN